MSAWLSRFIADDPAPEYSRLDRMDGLGSWEGKVAGPKTSLPIPAPEPRESVWHAIQGGLAVACALIGFVATSGSLGLLLAAWWAGWLS